VGDHRAQQRQLAIARGAIERALGKMELATRVGLVAFGHRTAIAAMWSCCGHHSRPRCRQSPRLMFDPVRQGGVAMSRLC
jgi:hypothetical protein